MTRFWILMAGVAVVALTAEAAVTAAPPDDTTYVTFDAAVTVPGATLRPGTYIFEHPSPDCALVRVLSRDRSQVYLTQFTRTVDRPARVAGIVPTVTLGEAVDGSPEPVKAWYPENSPTGQEFVYR